jgi:hypothetical protein
MCNFTSYFTEVDFEGIKIMLPSGYKYISRNANGFVYTSFDKPGTDESGDIVFRDECILTLGHQKSLKDLPTVVRKYRRKRECQVFTFTGVVE